MTALRLIRVFDVPKGMPPRPTLRAPCPPTPSRPRASRRVEISGLGAWALAVVLAMLPGAAAASQQAAQLQEQVPEQVPVQLPDVLPDVRIVSLDVGPRPLVDGSTVSLTLLLHNASSVVAAGNIVVQVVHDRGTPLPVAVHHEVVYMSADERVEVTFQVRDMAMRSSPYTFYAVVDAFDALLESNESNNTAWKRVDVCGDPLSVEVEDGFDNDCDGMRDEGLGLSADPDDAVRLLRVLQRRARLDAAPLVYALPRMFAPTPRQRPARLISEGGDFVGRPASRRGRRRARRGPGVELSVAATATDRGSFLTLVDWNGDDLRSGDKVSFRDQQGEFLVAEGGGGGRVVTRAQYHERERLFTVVKLDAPGASGDHVPSADRIPSDDRIRSGDTIVLVVSTGQFVSAEQGGGGPLSADRSAASGWESFTLILDDLNDGGTP